MLYPNGVQVRRYCVDGFFKNKTDVDKEIAAIEAVNAILGESDDRVCGKNYLLEIRPELPDRLALVQPHTRPIRRQHRVHVASCHYIDGNGHNRTTYYTSWEGMNAGVDRLIAKGYEIVAYG